MKSKLITHLEELYSIFDSNWVVANSLLLNLARKHKLSLGGSIGLSISRKKPHKVPGDIDLFTESYNDAWNFTSEVLKYLSNKPGSYGKLVFNNETKFTLEGVKNHIRISGPPYWLPICVMVMKEPVRYFLWNRTRVQYFDDIVSAAKKTTEIDKKERVPFSLDVSFVDEYYDDRAEGGSCHHRQVPTFNPNICQQHAIS
jgi:hypothetical protein